MAFNEEGASPIDNPSEAAREIRCKELAVMDWANTPSSKIRENLGGISSSTLAHYRQSEEYKQTIEMLRDEWETEIKKVPNGFELRKKIQQGMSISINVLLDILTSKSQNKDKIAAARLMAQLDGRFLKADMEDGGGKGKGVDSIAEELITAMKRQNGLVQ